MIKTQQHLCQVLRERTEKEEKQQNQLIHKTCDGQYFILHTLTGMTLKIIEIYCLVSDEEENMLFVVSAGNAFVSNQMNCASEIIRYNSTWQKTNVLHFFDASNCGNCTKLANCKFCMERENMKEREREVDSAHKIN